MSYVGLMNQSFKKVNYLNLVRDDRTMPQLGTDFVRPDGVEVD